MLTKRELEQKLSNLQNSLETFTDIFIQGDFDLDIYLITLADTLKSMTIIQAQIGKGKATLTETDQKQIKDYLKQVFTIGELTSREVTDDGKVISAQKKFGLKELLTDINSGNLTDKELKNRVKLYGQHTATIKNEIEINRRMDQEFNQVLNVLGQTRTGGGTNHSKLCIACQADGWMTIEDMRTKYGIPPRHPFCNCSLIYRKR